MGNPQEVFNFITLDCNGGGVQSNGLWADSGNMYPAPDGDRFYYGNMGDYSLYILTRANAGFENGLGKVFMQDRFTFAQDIGKMGGTLSELRKLSATKNVIEGFLDVYMGVLSCTSGPLAIAISGMKLVVATGQIKQDYDVYKKAIEVVLYHREFIRNNARTLEAVVISNLLLGQLEKTLSGKAKEKLLSKVPGPKVAGKIFGVFLGSIGEEQFKNQLKAVNTLFTDLLIKVVDHAAKVWPEKLSKQQIEDLAKFHAVKLVKLAGHFEMDKDTSERIVREVADNPLGLQGPLKSISAALSLK